VRVRLLHDGIGAVNKEDVTLAEASDGVIVAFRVVPDTAAKALAAERQIEIRRYDVIYQCLDEIRLAMEGLLDPESREVAMATVEIRKTFHFSKLGTIAGCYIQDGLLERSHTVRVVRDGRVIVPEARLSSLRRFENDVKEVKQGFECGLRVEKYDDLRVGDILESFKIEMVKRTLDGGDAVKAPGAKSEALGKKKPAKKTSRDSRGKQR
jgi:translation initiation factor IF-2